MLFRLHELFFHFGDVVSTASPVAALVVADSFECVLSRNSLGLVQCPGIRIHNPEQFEPVIFDVTDINGGSLLFLGVGAVTYRPILGMPLAQSAAASHPDGISGGIPLRPLRRGSHKKSKTHSGIHSRERYVTICLRGVLCFTKPGRGCQGHGVYKARNEKDNLNE